MYSTRKSYLILILSFISVWCYYNIVRPGRSNTVRNSRAHSFITYGNNTWRKSEVLIGNMITALHDTSYFEERVSNLRDRVNWNNIKKTTMGRMSTFELRNPKKSYAIGDHLCVTIQARDGQGAPKSFGGDYFRARMYSGILNASVNPDRIIDRNNGSYDVYFTMRWSGRSNISVMLAQPVEAIAVIKRVISRFPNRLSYYGLYEAPWNAKRTETSSCNVVAPRGAICNYSDPRYDAPLYCKKPEKLRCSHLKLIKYDDNKARLLMAKSLNDDEKSILKRIKEPLNGTISLNTVSDRPVETFSRSFPFCRLKVPRGMYSSGYFIKDKWRPFECQIKHFTPEDALHCLRDKRFYIYGDSTGRQLKEYLDFHLKGFETILDENFHLGPHQSYNKDFNITLYHQFHGFPVRLPGYSPFAAPFVFNEIDKLKGDDDTVVLFSLWAHFKKTSLSLYEKRILAILDAIERLLQRSPKTTVIFKGANTREIQISDDFFWPVCSSDWVSYQLEIKLRELLLKSKLNIGFIDAWDLTNAHQSEDMIHPNDVVVGTMVDQLLTHICAI